MLIACLYYKPLVSENGCREYAFLWISSDQFWQVLDPCNQLDKYEQEWSNKVQSARLCFLDGHVESKSLFLSQSFLCTGFLCMDDQTRTRWSLQVTKYWLKNVLSALSDLPMNNKSLFYMKKGTGTKSGPCSSGLWVKLLNTYSIWCTDSG